MDVEKTIEFILEQQAQLFVGLEQLRESHSRQHDLVMQLIAMMSQQATSLTRLTQVHRRTEENVQSLADKFEGMDRKLDAVIRGVNTLIRRNGRRP